MIDVIEAVDTLHDVSPPPTRARRSPLRTLLTAAVAAAAVGVLTLCITGGAESVGDQSPTPVTTTAP